MFWFSFSFWHEKHKLIFFFIFLLTYKQFYYFLFSSLFIPKTTLCIAAREQASPRAVPSGMGVPGWVLLCGDQRNLAK